MPPPFAVSVPIEPRALGATGRTVWVVGPRVGAGRTSGAAIELGATGRRLRLFGAGSFPNAVARTPGSLWIANGRDEGVEGPALGPNTVWRLRLRDGRVRARIDVPDPSALARGATGVWALTLGGGDTSTLRRISTVTNRVDATVSVPGTSFRGELATGGGSVWTLTATTTPRRRWILTRVRESTRRVVSKLAIHGVGQSLAYGGGSIWITTVVSRGGGSHGELLRVVDFRRRRVVARLPSAGRLAYGRGVVWVVTGRSTIQRFDAATGRKLGAAVVSGSVDGIAADAGGAWAFDRSRARVTRLRPPG